MIILCLASDNYVNTYDFCIDSQSRYCEKNDYKYHLVSGPKDSRNWKRAKIYELKTLLETTNDDILMIDSDCFIIEDAPPLSSFLTDKSIYYANGISNRLNSGFMYFKNVDNSKEFVNNLIQILDKSVPAGKGYFVTKGGENGHVIWLMSMYLEQNRDIFCEISYRWNCSNPKSMSDAYILHFTNLMKKFFHKFKNEYSRATSEG